MFEGAFMDVLFAAAAFVVYSLALALAAFRAGETHESKRFTEKIKEFSLSLLISRQGTEA